MPLLGQEFGGPGIRNVLKCIFAATVSLKPSNRLQLILLLKNIAVKIGV